MKPVPEAAGAPQVDSVSPTAGTCDAASSRGGREREGEGKKGGREVH